MSIGGLIASIRVAVLRRGTGREPNFAGLAGVTAELQRPVLRGKSSLVIQYAARVLSQLTPRNHLNASAHGHCIPVSLAWSLATHAELESMW